VLTMWEDVELKMTFKLESDERTVGEVVDKVG